MSKRVLVLGAGTGASNNLIRSLRAGDPSLLIVGCHDDRFVLKKSLATRNYLIPRRSHPRLLEALHVIVQAERVELIIPGSDADVVTLSTLRAELRCPAFIPPAAVVKLCQDKYELALFLQSRGVPVAQTYPVTDLNRIEELFRLFTTRRGHRDRLWCRMRTGTGSMGATAVRTPDQARGWISYWNEMRGVPVTSFTLSEYLPGRDFACQSVWKDGTVIVIKSCQRLSYLGGASRPSGVSSTPALAKTVFEPKVFDVSKQSICALDENPSGVFSVDLKENADGVPCVTEINAGRFFMMTNLFDLTGGVNMAAVYLRLAFDETVRPVEVADTSDAFYLVRDFDTCPDVFRADELFTGIADARP